MDEAYKQRLFKLLGGASLATVLYGALFGLVPVNYLVSLESSFGSRAGWVVAVLSWLPILVIASLPSLYILKGQGLDKAHITVLLGDVLAFVLLTGYMFFAMFTRSGLWNTTLVQLVALFAAFVFVDSIMRKRRQS